MSNSTISGSTFVALARASTASVCNAAETFKVQLRNEGFIDRTVVSRIDPGRPMLGHALTIEMRTDLPPTTGMGYVDRTDWWEILASGPQPKIIVIADVGETRAVGSVTGEIHASIYKAMGAIGIVTDGAIRDVNELEGLGLHIYSSHIVPSHAYAHIVSIGLPVTIGGLRIESGDLLHGDQDGIFKIPRAIANDLPSVITAMKDREREILDLCKSSDFSVTALRKLVSSFPDAI